MDLKMKAETITSTAHPVWDVKVTNGIVPMITGDEENTQTATLAGFLEYGTIPQLPAEGVPWSDFLTGIITFGELDAYIRESIQHADKAEYYPQYEIETDRLTMTVGKNQEE